MSKSVKRSHYSHFVGKDVSTRTRVFKDHERAYKFAETLEDAHYSVSTRYRKEENIVSWDVELQSDRVPMCPNPDCEEILDYVREFGRTNYSADRHKGMGLDDVETEGGEEGESWSCPECSTDLDTEFVEKHFPL